MTSLDLHPKAEKEIEQAQRYYNKKRDGLGEEFLDELEITFQFMELHPKAGAFFLNTSFRKRTLNRFPYVVYYQEKGDTIWVVAVAHGKRKPGYWLSRIE